MIFIYSFLEKLKSFRTNFRCRGGYVKVTDGDVREAESPTDDAVGISMRQAVEDPMSHSGEGKRWRRNSGTISFKICGEDQRLHPPAVLFSDTGRATIVYR